MILIFAEMILIFAVLIFVEMILIFAERNNLNHKYPNNFVYLQNMETNFIEPG